MQFVFLKTIFALLQCLITAVPYCPKNSTILIEFSKVAVISRFSLNQGHFGLVGIRVQKKNLYCRQYDEWFIQIL